MLPKLVFGDGRAATFVREREIIDELGKTRRPIRDFSFRSPQEGRTRLFILDMAGLLLASSATDAYRARLDGEPRLSVFVPTNGAGHILQDGRRLGWRSRRDLLFTNYAEPQVIEAERNAWLAIHPDERRLRETIAAMHGDREMRADGWIPPVSARYPAAVRGRDFQRGFLSLCGLIEAADCDGAHLAAIGADDVFYRLVSDMLTHDTMPSDALAPDRQPARSLAALDEICDRILEFPASPLTLTEMERLTGLSSRALRYAFQKRFDCSPRQWQRNAYLDRAREMIRTAEEPLTVRTLSYQLGFSSPQTFASFYRQRFGELPSEAIAAQKRRSHGTE